MAVTKTEMLRQAINQYLDEEVRLKTEEDRTRRETLILEAAETLVDLLLRQNAAKNDEGRAAESVARLLSAYRKGSVGLLLNKGESALIE